MAVRPDVTAVVTVDEFGDATASVSGAACTGVVVVDRADAWSQLVDLATQAGRSLRVRTVDEHGRTYRDIVDPKPPVREKADADVSETSTATPAAAVPSEPVRVDSDVSARQESPVIRPAEPGDDMITGRAAEPVQVAIPEPAEAETAHTSTVDAGGRDDRACSGGGDGTSYRNPAPVLAGMAAVLFVVGVVLLTTGDGAPDEPAASPSTSAAYFAPVIAPAGWSQVSAWRAELAPDTSPAVTSTGLVAVTTGGGRLDVVDPATATTLWSTPADGAGAPMPTRLDGDDAVAWQRPGELIVWSHGGEARVLEIAVTAHASRAGGRVMVTDPDRPRQVQVLTAVDLREVAIPDGTTALGATVHHVVASDGRPVLWRSPISGGEPEPVTLDRPDGLSIRRWAGMAGETVTVVWDRPGDPDPERAVTVTTHDARTGEALASTAVDWSDVATVDLTAEASWEPAAVTLGPVVFSLRDDAERTVVPGASWHGHHGDDVWGSKNGIGLHVDRRGRIGAVATATPLAIGAGGTAVVVDNDTAYALHPDDDDGSARDREPATENGNTS